MLHVGSVVIGAADVARAADFWCRALGYEPRDGEVRDDWAVLVPAVLADTEGNRFCVIDTARG